MNISVSPGVHQGALNCRHNVDRNTSKTQRLLTNCESVWQALRPNVGSKDKLRQQFNLHVSHTGSFFYRRTSKADGVALPFAVQQPCRPLFNEQSGLKETSCVKECAVSLLE